MSAENKYYLLPVTSDFIFKLIFGDKRNLDILASFLKAVLDIPEDEYEKLVVIDPHLKKEYKKDKYGILDVKVITKSGNVIHIEIQVLPIPEMIERSVYYQSKLVTEQIRSGQDYSEIKRAVSIIITDQILIEGDDDYHNQFRYRNKKGKEFTNLVEINTLELAKLPVDSDNTDLWYWLRFISTSNKEELNMLKERNVHIKKAANFLEEISADAETRKMYEDREKARRDMVSRLVGAKREGKIEVARKLLKRNRPIEKIIEDTGLTHEEIESLKTSEQGN